MDEIVQTIENAATAVDGEKIEGKVWVVAACVRVTNIAMNREFEFHHSLLPPR